MVSSESDAISDFPAKLLGQFAVHNTTSLIVLPGGQLIVGDLEVRHHGKDFGGIGSKLCEEVLGLVFVFVQAAEPTVSEPPPRLRARLRIFSR